MNDIEKYIKYAKIWEERERLISQISLCYFLLIPLNQIQAVFYREDPMSLKGMMKILNLCLVGVFSLMLLYTSAEGAITITVPDDYTTIQAAINAASPGDTVYVRAGTYSPSTNGEVFPIMIRVDGINLTGEGVDVCIIDPEVEPTIPVSPWNPTLLCEADNIVIDGFTIKGFSKSDSLCIYSEGQIMTLKNCSITYTYLGIVSILSTSTITDNQFTDCNQGIISYQSHGHSIVMNNEFYECGLAIDCYKEIPSSMTVVNNLMIDLFGRGMRNFESSHPIINNVITGPNIGIENMDGSNCIISNNIIAECNWFGIKNEDSSPTITSNNFWDIDIADIENTGTSSPTVAENISGDPLFVDPGLGDFHLQMLSPCIDSGDNSAPGLPAFDLDGNSRIFDGDGDSIPIVDMGPYEFSGGIPAVINIEPGTINLKSKGKKISAYIELPEGFDVAEISAISVYLNGAVQAEENPASIGDFDDDGILDLMLKFNRSEVNAIITEGEAVEITITGELNSGQPFQGSCFIKVKN
jgi:hypothetical protein